jgi:Tfp pilus assembly protein PilZ
LAVTGNVSKGGCFIQTDNPLPEGTPIWLEFSFVDIPVKLGNILGRVVWSTQTGDPVQGMGIKYEKVPDVVEELMEEFIESVKNAGKPQRTN